MIHQHELPLGLDRQPDRKRVQNVFQELAALSCLALTLAQLIEQSAQALRLGVDLTALAHDTPGVPVALSIGFELARPRANQKSIGTLFQT